MLRIEIKYQGKAQTFSGQDKFSVIDSLNTFIDTIRPKTGYLTIDSITYYVNDRVHHVDTDVMLPSFPQLEEDNKLIDYIEKTFLKTVH